MGMVLLLLFTTLASPAIGAEPAHFKSNDCFEDFAFDYPADWEAVMVRRPESRYVCEVGLRPLNWLESIAADEMDRDEFSLYVQLSGSRFLEAAAAEGFDFDGTRWTVSLGEHPNSAKLIGTKAWYGLRGEPNIRVYRKAGGYVGQSDITIYVLTRPYVASAILKTTSSKHSDVLDRVVQTFRFVAPTP